MLELHRDPAFPHRLRLPPPQGRWLQVRPSMAEPQSPPPDVPPGEYISYERGVHEPFPGAQVGNVRHPQPMRARSPTFTIDQVWATIRTLGFACCDRCLRLCPCRTDKRCASAGLCARVQCQCLGVAARATFSAPRKRCNFQHERREYAPRQLRRDNCGRLHRRLWIGGTHAK